MFKWTLRNRLLISFLSLIITTILLFGSYMLWYFHQYTISNLTSHLFAHAEITSQFLQEYMRGPYEKSAIDEKIKELSTMNRDIRITVIDTDGKVLADSWENPNLMENHAGRPEVITAFSGHPGSSVRYSTTISQNTLYAAVPIWHGPEIVGVVRVANTLFHVESIFTEIASTILTALFFTCLLSTALSIRLSKKYTAPLETITQSAREMGKGRLEKRIHIHTGDELELLAHTLNSLASGLEDTINEITGEKRKLELILEHMDNAVILLDRVGRITTANRQAYTLFGITPEMLGRHNLQVIGNGLLDKAVQETASTGKALQLTLKDTLQNQQRVFQVFLAPIAKQSKTADSILTVFHDITTLQQIQDRQSEFIANASHELATPLTSIKGFAETLLDGALEDKGLREKFVSIILEEAERMQRLTQSLLQLAKLRSADYRQQIPMAPLWLAPLLEQASQEMSRKMADKNLTFSLELSSDTTPIMANSDLIKQLLLNLLDNSVKYTPEGGQILLGYRQTTDKALITVQDTGIGIAPQHLPLIFERFYRTDKARSRKEGGSGLGLAIVKFIVELHGGAIEVQSQLNEGTSFTVTLPLQQ